MPNWKNKYKQSRNPIHKAMEHLDPITAPEIFGSVHRILQVNIIDVSGALSHVLEVQQGGDVAGD